MSAAFSFLCLSDFLSFSAVVSSLGSPAHLRRFPPRRKHLGRQLLLKNGGARLLTRPSLARSAPVVSAAACRRRWWAGGLPRQPLSLTEGRLTARAEEAAQRMWVHLSPYIGLFSFFPFLFFRGNELKKKSQKRSFDFFFKIETSSFNTP